MKNFKVTILLLGMALALSACACRPGYIGPYGGVHPGGCILY